MKITSNISNILIDTNILGDLVISMKTLSNVAKILTTCIFREILGNQVISMNIMSNYLIHINILGN